MFKLINDNISGGSVFYLAMAELLAKRNVVLSDIVDTLNVDRAIVFEINSMRGVDAGTFVNILNNSQAVQLDVNWNRVESVIDSIADFEVSQVYDVDNHSVKFYDAAQQKKDVNRLFKRSVYLAFSRMLMDNLFRFNEYEQSNSGIVVPNGVLRSLTRLNSCQFSLLAHVLHIKDTIKLSINESSFRTAMMAYRASSSANSLVRDLIEAGANFHFVNTYNGVKVVEKDFFNNWRSVLSPTRKNQKVSSRLSHDIWAFYTKSINDGAPIVDVYLSMHRKFQLRIDTLYNEIQRITKAAELVDDDDFSDLQSVMNS